MDPCLTCAFSISSRNIYRVFLDTTASFSVCAISPLAALSQPTSIYINVCICTRVQPCVNFAHVWGAAVMLCVWSMWVQVAHIGRLCMCMSLILSTAVIWLYTQPQVQFSCYSYIIPTVGRSYSHLWGCALVTSSSSEPPVICTLDRTVQHGRLKWYLWGAFELKEYLKKKSFLVCSDGCVVKLSTHLHFIKTSVTSCLLCERCVCIRVLSWCLILCM